MKKKRRTFMLKPILLLLIAEFIAYSGWSQIVAYDLTSSNAATAGIAANYPGQGKVMNISGLTSSGFSTSNGHTCYAWNSVGNDSWVTSSFSTAGYINITGSAQMKANTGVGPRDFKVQYSLDGTTWHDASTGSSIYLTNSLVTYNFKLPVECDNKANMYVRWVQNSAYNLNGTALGTGSTANASLKGVSIAGDPFAAPSTQASNISIISVTPTTIKIGCTNGNGNNRIIKINNTNSFTTPTNDYYPTANTTYAGTGEQVIYNGTNSSLTVSVPNTTNVYWFRVYDFNKMDNLTRYKTDTASSNPKQCKLESINTPTYTNIRLTRATLGANIVTPTTGTISERGIFWSTTSPVDETSNLVSVTSNLGGVYTISNIDVDRGTTIYFKGYVTNESGTIMSEESSFSNIPIFTGTGNWETAARWNVQEVPGNMGDQTYGSIDDNPIINGNCTLTSENSVTDLTINSGSGKSLTINPNVTFDVMGVLTNSNDTSGLVIKSDASGTGSLIHFSNDVSGIVERFISGTSNLLAKKYHLVSVPIKSATYYSGVWLDSYLFTYNENANTWYYWNSPTGNTLQSKVGAMVFYPNWGATTSKTYRIGGQLNNGSYSPTVAYTGSNYGYNLVPNPYPSAIDWESVSGWTKTNIGNVIWGFNSTNGSYGSWNGTTGTNGVTNIIPVGQGFFVLANGSNPVLSMDNNVRLHDITTPFLKSNKSAEQNILHITAAGSLGRDEIAIQLANNATTLSTDNLDAIKFVGSMYVPEFSSFTNDDPNLLSINALPNTPGVSVVPFHFELKANEQITFTATGMNSFSSGTTLTLEDQLLNIFTVLNSTATYQFSHDTLDSHNRFRLHIGNTVGVNSPSNNLKGNA